MRRWWFAIAFAALSAASVGCGAPAEEPADPATDLSATAREDRPVPVRTILVEPSSFVEHLEVTGVVEPWRAYALATEFGGSVQDVPVDRGDRVGSGQVVARIGDDLARALLDQARADLMASEANFAKVQALADRDAVPEQDRVAATARRDRDRAVVTQAELRLLRSTIRSPADGVVVRRDVDPGEVVPPGAPVATVHETARLKVEASVPDTEIAWISAGAPARILVDAWPDRPVVGKVRYAAPAADPATRTFDVEFEVRGADPGVLRPGMVVRVRLDRRAEDGVVVAPQDALVVGVDGTDAFVVEDCRAVRRRVRVGATEDGQVLIREGLAVGDRLVVEGQRDLADRQRVVSEDCR